MGTGRLHLFLDSLDGMCLLRVPIRLAALLAAEIRAQNVPGPNRPLSRSRLPNGRLARHKPSEQELQTISGARRPSKSM
jgi:hypothetical protein